MNRSLSALQPRQALPELALKDINGERIVAPTGRKLLVSLFREASCPFCNIRVYELTRHHRKLRSLNIEIVAVFQSSEVDVKRFIARQPRPFRSVADPQGVLHQKLGGQSSLAGKMKAMMFRMVGLFRGMSIVGTAGMKTGNAMPVDILVDEFGRIETAYYGRDAGDHIPVAQIMAFAIGTTASPVKKASRA
jgi:peroxiredoxin